MQEIVSVISYKLMVSIMQKRDGLDHASRASEKIFQFKPSITLEKSYWQSRQTLRSSLIWYYLAFEAYMFHRIDNGKKVKNDDLDICYAIFACQ